VADFRVIPSIDQLRRRPTVRALEAQYGVQATVGALREAAGRLRAALADHAATPSAADDAAGHLEADAARALAVRFRGSLRPVINATGVILHTNLGRAPLAETALARLADVARGYSNLEYDLARGTRGSRGSHAEPLLTAVTGAGAAVVVNNNAAATLLILAALASGREVVISRGELVEIGGGFRVPDVMRQSGAVLREVGTTNRTRVADYTAAISERTALILRVHPSNFRVEGFTERPALQALVGAARAVNVPLVEDLGSGCLTDDLPDEPSVQASIAAGVDVVCFSGDKLLGGPQAGVIVGRAAFIDRLRAHPLMRALRVDKLTLAALEATLAEYAAGRARETVPAQRMLHLDAATIEGRAHKLGAALERAGWRVSYAPGESAAGGGSAPGLRLPTVLLAIARDGPSADALEARLRALDPPIIARIVNDALVLDLRTVLPEQDELLASLLMRDA
jgi:L-seryl-tRNA(Ser) seleniumtransferase